MPKSPKPSAKNDTGEFDRFKGFMQRLVAVPHTEIRAQLDAEKLEKQNRKVKTYSSGRASGGKG